MRTLAEHGLDAYLQEPIPVKALINIWNNTRDLDFFYNLGFCRNIVDFDFVIAKQKHKPDTFLLFFADESILQLIGNHKQRCYNNYAEYRMQN